MEILWTSHKYTPYTLYEPPNYIPWQKDRGPAEGEVPEGRGSTPAGSRHLKSSEGRGQARGQYITPNNIKKRDGTKKWWSLLPTTSCPCQRFLKKTKSLNFRSECSVERRERPQNRLNQSSQQHLEDQVLPEELQLQSTCHQNLLQNQCEWPEAERQE